MLIFQWFDCSSFFLCRPLNPRGPLGSPGRGFGCRVVPCSCLGKRRVTCVRVRTGSRARCVVVGHAWATFCLTRRRLIIQGASRWSRYVPSGSCQH